MNLFRIVQEATHNINKFAEAKNVVISFVLDEQNICLSITDNGIGFDPEIITDGIGLHNMKQRVKNLKGNLVIQSIKNKSTSINIAIPLM
jgi:signal transduction histidine kinase